MDNNINVPNTNNNFDNQYNNSNVNYNPTQQFNNGYVPNIPNNNNKKNNTGLIIVICIAVLAVLVGGVFFIGKTIFDAAGDVVDEVEKEIEDKDEDKDKDKVSSKLHAFNKYESYKFVMKIVIVADDMEITTTSNGIADVKNSTDYMETTATTMGYSVTSYSYSDYNAGYTYTSDDKITWESDVTAGTESINLDDIINKINNNDNDVTVLSDNHYSVKIDYESGDVSYNGVYADVYVTNGYISKLSYNLTSVVASEGFSKFTIDIQISDFNEAGSVVIPDNVKKANNSI